MKYLAGGPRIRKALEIIRCSQCHYMEHRRPTRVVCINVDDLEPRDIPYPNGIPYWCPLEDWPDE